MTVDGQHEDRSPKGCARSADGREKYVRPEVLDLARNYGAGMPPTPSVGMTAPSRDEEEDPKD